MKYDLFADFYVKSGDEKPRYTCVLGSVNVTSWESLEAIGFKPTHSDGFLDYVIDNATEEQLQTFTLKGYVSEVMDVLYNGVDFERICISALEVEIMDDDGHYPPRGVLIGNVFAEFRFTEPNSPVDFTEDYFEYEKRNKRSFSVPYHHLKERYGAMTQSEVMEKMREEFEWDPQHELTFEVLQNLVDGSSKLRG